MWPAAGHPSQDAVPHPPPLASDSGVARPAARFCPASTAACQRLGGSPEQDSRGSLDAGLMTIVNKLKLPDGQIGALTGHFKKMGIDAAAKQGAGPSSVSA